MCATTKYVSWKWKSSGADASMTPVMPPSRKFSMKAMLHHMGVGKVILPPHIVPIQLKNLMPVGMAIRKDMKEKNGLSTAPVVNMWCAQTVIDRPAMASEANTKPA